MLSETLSEGLENYRIGPKIRTLRTGRGLGLAQLGDHTGLSAGMLSKIERGQVFPTLPTLLRIAMVFGVGLEYFFAEGAITPVIEVLRAKDRLRLPDQPQGDPTYFFESLDFPVSDSKLCAYLAEFPAAAPGSEPHSHAGAEVLYVISGQLELTIHGAVQLLDQGDSIYFDPSFEHTYRGVGDLPCTAIVVTTPKLAE
ncbi:HTH-type transcriptional regulator PuuR [Thalassovita gelatinovora]|uniref:HTH-type transcriptional regulator PuuR n=1 Tax=Thalassovita gelatinovora TaxID=53501 RepID=A0A0P1FG55_THAGE|nr:XRE family transcriptional regulator [Thalassovita gelatinovora]QIZ79877.1 helix-turn-helix domain-containing protein [Thalassovita gelatinovora]CUH66984.1 HTH-type transcriptional regulator PuuR [Thalassovita gelatinovora]SEQ46366.1 transcriptional regulator, XRE family with cupin sensor [Thalassovita gelatinovora]